jgi:hypothetical protein
MPRNPDSPMAGGSNKDPEFRRLRGQYGAERRDDLDRHIARIVDRAPELTAEQFDKLAALLRNGAA